MVRFIFTFASLSINLPNFMARSLRIWTKYWMKEITEDSISKDVLCIFGFLTGTTKMILWQGGNVYKYVQRIRMRSTYKNTFDVVKRTFRYETKEFCFIIIITIFFISDWLKLHVSSPQLKTANIFTSLLHFWSISIINILLLTSSLHFNHISNCQVQVNLSVYFIFQNHFIWITSILRNISS